MATEAVNTKFPSKTKSTHAVKAKASRTPRLRTFAREATVELCHMIK